MKVDSRKLNQARIQRGLLLRELAERTKLSVGAVVSACSRGRSRLTSVRRLCEVLDLELATVLVEEKATPNAT